MKKLIALVLICFSATAMAQHHHGGYHHHHGNYGWGWVGPALLGGAVVYAATRPPVVVQQPTVITTPPPVVTAPSDIVYIDGYAYRKQLMLINGNYQEVLIRL